MYQSAFQLFKNGSQDNANAWLHNIPIVDYGRVIKVIDLQTVVVETIVRASSSIERFTVTLLSLSSVLLEISDAPNIGDTVLLLFLRKHDPLMFMSETVKNTDATGYNKFSGVGILMSTAKKTAHTILSFYYSDKEKPVADLRSDAEVSATFNNITTLTFCRAVFDSEDEALISILFGEGRPLVEKHLSRIERLHGFWKGPDNGLIPMDASVTEKYSVYAPITKEIQGTRTTNTGLGTDKDGAPVETDAPVIEIVHGKAPVTRDIRSPQNVTIGIGNDESGDAGEQRDAAVSYTLGEKADITVTSKSALTMGFKKAVSLETEEDYDLKALGEIKAECEGKASVKAEGDVSITSGGKCYIGNSSMDMLQLMLDFVTEIKNLKTFGSPGMHTVDPSSIASLTVFEQEINSLLKGGA